MIPARSAPDEARIEEACRIAAGKDTLYKNAIGGKGAMPPKGGSSLSDDDFKKVVDYLVGLSK